MKAGVYILHILPYMQTISFPPLPLVFPSKEGGSGIIFCSLCLINFFSFHIFGLFYFPPPPPGWEKCFQDCLFLQIFRTPTYLISPLAEFTPLGFVRLYMNA